MQVSRQVGMDIETGRHAAQAKTLHQTCTPEVFNALVCKG